MLASSRPVGGTEVESAGGKPLDAKFVVRGASPEVLGNAGVVASGGTTGVTRFLPNMLNGSLRATAWSVRVLCWRACFDERHIQPHSECLHVGEPKSFHFRAKHQECDWCCWGCPSVPRTLTGARTPRGAGARCVQYVCSGGGQKSHSKLCHWMLVHRSMCEVQATAKRRWELPRVARHVSMRSAAVPILAAR